MVTWKRSWVLAVLAVIVSASGLVARAQQPTFRAGTQVVSLFVTVQDVQRRLIPDLMQDEFQIFDNDKPQPLVYFDNSVHPINVVVMLDTSGSMTLTIGLLKQAAEQFIIRLLPEDKARIGAFNDKIQINAKWSNNRDQLATDIKDLDFGNGTRLWDAVGTALDELKAIEGRRVVLVFTDGDDTESKSMNLGRVIERARVDEEMIYEIGLESRYFNG